MVKLVINGDDFGMTDGICRAIRDLFDQGAISSTSVMVAAPGAPERSRRWGLRQLHATAGVHLQLTDGAPVLQSPEARNLVDPTNGKFRSDIPRTLSNLVLQEWRAQIDLAAELIGGAPSHLDSHHGVHHLPEFVDLFIELATEYKLPVRGGSKIVSERMQKNHIAGTDEVLFDWTGRDLGISNLELQLRSASNALGASGSLELVTHPAYCDAELMAISSLNTARDGDRIALQELAASDWLNLHGFVLVSYSQIGSDKITTTSS